MKADGLFRLWREISATLSDRERRWFYGKKNVAVTPAFTGRNVSLSEISQASGIGIATLKKGLIAGAVDFGYAIPCGKGDQHCYYCPDKLVYEKSGTSMRRCNYA